MRELLEKLKDVMPSGWILRLGEKRWNLYNLPPKGGWTSKEPSYDEWFYGDGSDPEWLLAPLTALLKQELGVRLGDIIEVQSEYRVPGISSHSFSDGGEEIRVFGRPTEFEAVANAYLSLRPKEAR